MLLSNRSNVYFQFISYRETIILSLSQIYQMMASNISSLSLGQLRTELYHANLSGQNRNLSRGNLFCLHLHSNDGRRLSLSYYHYVKIMIFIKVFLQSDQIPSVPSVHFYMNKNCFSEMNVK